MSQFTDQLRRGAESGDSSDDVSENLAKAADMIDRLELRQVTVIDCRGIERLAVMFPEPVSAKAVDIIREQVAKWVDMPAGRVAVFSEGAELAGLNDGITSTVEPLATGSEP